MDKLDFTDTRNDEEFKEFTDAPIDMKKQVLKIWSNYGTKLIFLDISGKL